MGVGGGGGCTVDPVLISHTKFAKSTGSVSPLTFLLDLLGSSKTFCS